MSKLIFLLFSLAILLPKNTVSGDEGNSISHRKPYRRLSVMPRLQATEVQREISRLRNRAGMKVVVISNNAKDTFLASCSSAFDDPIQDERLEIGQSYLFQYKPIPNESTPNFQCSVDYKGYAAVWDATNYLRSYVERNDTVYHYVIHHDGVYINEARIQGLVSLENRYLLCKENFALKYYPDCLPGYVNAGVCNNLPVWIVNKVSSVTMADFGCITLYDDYNCSGNRKKIKLINNGQTQNNLDDFQNMAVSVEGCSFEVDK